MADQFADSAIPGKPVGVDLHAGLAPAAASPVADVCTPHPKPYCQVIFGSAFLVGDPYLVLNGRVPYHSAIQLCTDLMHRSI